MAKRFITREFTPAAFEEEMSANVNGHPLYPPHNMSVNPSTLRLINIHVSAEGVTTDKLFSKTDPMCVMLTQTPRGWHEYGRTEVCWDILDPVWVRPFTFNVIPGKPELLSFEIYDIVETFYELSEQKMIGSAQLDLNTLLCSPEHMVKLDIVNERDGKGHGVLTVSFFDLEPTHGSMFFKMGVRDIKGGGMFGRANPFFVISRYSPYCQDFVAVYKSAVHSKTHAVDWGHIELFKQFVCGRELSNALRFTVYDHQRSDTDNYLGQFETTLLDLQQNGTTEFDIINRVSGEFTGKFMIKYLSHCETPRLFDYRLFGVQLSATIAIDFSSSTCGLAFSNIGQHLETGVFSYRYAINDVCDLLQPLTMGQPYSAYAFADFPNGLKLKSLVTRRARETLLNATMLLRSYEQSKRTAKFPSTAQLMPVIETARDDARRKWDQERTISILAVITNGLVADLPAAIDSLVDAEEEPLVVILVVMGGPRRALEKAFKHRHGILTSSTGKTTHRRILKMVTYLEDRVYPDPRLPKKLMPAAKAMTRKWLEFTDFYKKAKTAQV